MISSKDTHGAHELAHDHLKAKLRTALATNDVTKITDAVAPLMKSIGMTEMARRTGRPRQTLYKFTGEGNPSIGTFFTALDAMGLKLTLA